MVLNKIDMTKEAYENCNHFRDCSFNKCVLHEGRVIEGALILNKQKEVKE